MKDRLDWHAQALLDRASPFIRKVHDLLPPEKREIIYVNLTYAMRHDAKHDHLSGLKDEPVVKAEINKALATRFNPIAPQFS